MKKLYSIFILLCIVAPLFAQQPLVISGTVYDETGGYNTGSKCLSEG